MGILYTSGLRTGCKGSKGGAWKGGLFRAFLHALCNAGYASEDSPSHWYQSFYIFITGSMPFRFFWATLYKRLSRRT